VSRDAAGRARRVYAVGDLLAGISALLQDRVGRVWVAGEVSNLHRAASGHCYFTLKDERGQIRAALFRQAAARVPFELEEGLEVLYEQRGDLQIIVRELEPRGQGALQLAFEQLRARLEAEGLFEEARKRPIPRFPRRVGIVTSLGAAALRDVIEVAGRCFPAAPLLISPTRVQGEGAAEEIAAALDTLAAHGGVDVILLVRGGGSLEDLWAFNMETVARAIERCEIPVACGVGHETDFTIADWVADLRAPTPSAVAARVLPDRAALLGQLDRDRRRLAGAMEGVLEGLRTRLTREQGALRALAPTARLAAQHARLRRASELLSRAGQALREGRQQQLAELAARLDSLSPLAVLARGYALVRRLPDGAIPRRAAELARGDRLAIQLAAADVEAVVERIAEREAD